MRIRMLGGWAVEHDGRAVEVTGDRQRALLFRLALEPGTHLGYRAIAEDVWPDDLPENPRASLQSLVSRLRTQLPVDVIASTPGGYRLEIPREAVDAARFQDLVAASAAASDASDAARLAGEALELWVGPPWTPDAGYDWLERDLARDHAAALSRSAHVPGAAGADIPAPLTEIIGREAELARVDEQLELSRLVTILGPGGAGKTRLAIETARARASAVLVELAPAGPDEVPQAVLSALGREIRASAAESSTATASVGDRIRDAVRGRQLLLVLDNCEHVIEAAAALAAGLLAGEPRLRILTTSREPLGVPGEAFVPLGALHGADAERLFADRVRAARGTPLLDAERESALRICARLDGLPLALELAAAKARTLTIDELAAGLDDRFTLLAGGLRTALPRHQTLRALIDWSWTLLDDDERALLQVVAIHPAGIAVRDAAEVAAAHALPVAAFDALVDKSLLQRSGGRFRALETIREYGLERLAESGELAARRREQAGRLADAVTREDARLRGPAIHEAIAWFDAEDDNLAAVIRYAAAGGLTEQALRIVAGSAWYWIIRDRNEDAVVWLTQLGDDARASESDAGLLVRALALMMTAFSGMAEAHATAVPADIDAELRHITALAEGREGDILQVMPPLMRAFAASLRPDGTPAAVVLPVDDPALRPWPRAMLAAVRSALAHNVGDMEQLERSSALALELFGEIGDLWGLALAGQMRSQWLAVTGRLEEALAAADRSTDDLRAITSAWDLQQQQGLGVMLLLRMGRVDDARARAAQLLVEAETARSSRAVLFARMCAAQLALELGETTAAERHIADADEAAADWGSPPPQMTSLVHAMHARLLVAQGRPDEALAELEVAAPASVASGDYPIMASVALGVAELALADHDLAGARAALDDAERLRGIRDLSDPLENRIRDALEAAPATASGPGDAASHRSERLTAVRQILRR